MTLQEVIDEIRKDTKCYIGIMPQSSFSRKLRLIEAGLAKDSTVLDFMQKLGYTVEKERTWKKKSM